MWEGVSRGLGVVIILVILVILIRGDALKDSITIQSLLAIAALLLGLGQLFRRNGGGK